MKTTKKEIEDATEELRLALMESMEADQQETKATQRRTKAHCRLRLAQQAIRAIQFNQQV